MNISTSECSSGGESGWTMYFDQISTSTDQYNNNTSVPHDQYDYRSNYKSKGKIVNQEEDEDLSMISDASSWPPQYFQQEHEEKEEEISENTTRYITAISGTESKKGKHKKKGTEHRRTESLNFHLDDTASSPAFNFTKNNAALEHDNKSLTYYHHSAVSATRVKGKSVLGKHFRFFKS